MNYILHIPELSDTTLYSYEDGWFITHKRPGQIFFYNIFSGEKIMLPPKSVPWEDEEWALFTLCFSAAPPASSIVLAIERTFAKKGFVISTCELGSDSWTRNYIPYVDDEYDEDSFHPCYNRPIFRHEVFYLLGRYATIAIFDPATRVLQVIPNHEEWSFGCDAYLVNQEERVMAVFMDKGDFPSGMYEFRHDYTWEEVNDFRNESLYLGRYTSIFLLSFDEGNMNAILLNKFKGPNQFLVMHPFDDEEIEARRCTLWKSVFFTFNSWITLPKTVFEKSKEGQLSLDNGAASHS